MTPITGLVRFLPFGRPGHAQPYGGVGIVAANFSNTETGEFVDTTDFTIFRDTYKATGTALAPCSPSACVSRSRATSTV